jgi:hypothetical protein
MTLQPEGAYYRSLGHDTTKEHDNCHPEAHSHRDDSGPVHFRTANHARYRYPVSICTLFPLLGSYSSNFLLFSLLIMNRLTNKSESPGVASIVLTVTIPKDHVSYLTNDLRYGERQSRLLVLQSVSFLSKGRPSTLVSEFGAGQLARDEHITRPSLRPMDTLGQAVALLAQAGLGQLHQSISSFCFLSTRQLGRRVCRKIFCALTCSSSSTLPGSVKNRASFFRPSLRGRQLHFVCCALEVIV